MLSVSEHWNSCHSLLELGQCLSLITVVMCWVKIWCNPQLCLWWVLKPVLKLCTVNCALGDHYYCCSELGSVLWIQHFLLLKNSSGILHKTYSFPGTHPALCSTLLCRACSYSVLLFCGLILTLLSLPFVWQVFTIRGIWTFFSESFSIKYNSNSILAFDSNTLRTSQTPLFSLAPLLCWYM